MISCDKKYKLGLIGHPVSHSQSPTLFRETFSGQPDVLRCYSYDLVEEADFDTAFGRFMSEYMAVNVTAPFKTRAFQAADICSGEARLCGATNLLVKENGTVKAYNTDCLAVKKILQDAGFGAGDVAHVYGCGGAGRAAAVAALMLGMRVRIYNRTRSVAEDFVRFIYSRKNELVSSGNLSIAERWTDTGTSCDSQCKQAIIYTLPVIPSALMDAADLSAWQQSLHGKLVIEANYKNAHLDPETLKSVSVPAYRYISGLEWLRLQALETYRIVMTIQK